ncbi:DMT family transporter [Burkholderia sp. LMG 21824]|uniref:DMT family transporter n=1 Tax=Burkholderia sp. LMG 21824 TaxID=3158172 RepID=UPI003C303E15
MVNNLWKNGVLLAVLASFTFSIMNALVKELSSTLPPSEIGFFRGVIGAALVYLLMLREKLSFSRSDLSMLIVRGLMGAFYLICYFYAIAHIPLADASILAHLSPVFIILLAAIFLKERIPKSMWLLLPVILVGAVLVVKPYQYSSYSIYAGLGLLSAVFAGGAHVAIRQLSGKHHAYEIVFYFLAIAALVSVPLMWKDFVWPNTGREWGLLLALGGVSLFGQLFLTKAFTHEKASVVAVTRYIGIVFNATWGWLFWRESMDVGTIVGGVLIVIACILLSRLKTT